jgi:glycosyltransferase involved in cell wall biosynthesis
MKRVLIYYKVFHSWVGGGRFLPLLFIAELQKTCEITLALDTMSDVANGAKLAGIPLDASKLKVVQVMPKREFFRKIDATLPFYRIRQLKKLAKKADVCISTVNMIDFGKPAHHFVYIFKTFGDNAFIDYCRHIPPPKGFPGFKRNLRTFLAEKILRPMLGIRSTRKIIADPRERIYPTSRYVDSVMRGFYGPFTSTVFYPPTAFEVNLSGVERDPLQVNYIGRISEEKRIEDIIRIVELARNSSGSDLKLHIAGQMENTPYAEKLKRIAKEKNWIRFVGMVLGEAKERFLLSGTYAIHAERDETFGIAITEYLKAGSIPVVPDEGGTMEIVDSPALTYHDNEEAAAILTKLLQDEEFRKEQLAHCAKRAEAFTMKAYLENQRLTLEKILEESD